MTIQAAFHQSSNNTFSEVLAIVHELAKITYTGQFIFRGECECHDSVSSSLYRQFRDLDIDDHFDAGAIQQPILNRAKAYTDEPDDLEILSQIQHYGGSTNLIDFTTDYLVALFFACYASPSQDARIILLKKHGSLAPYIREPRRIANRVIAQHSIFVLPPKGIIEEYEVVTISSALKQPLT